MVNLWSPDADDDEAVEYGYYENVPAEPSEVETGDSRASVVIGNKTRHGKIHQMVERHTPIGQWTDSDLSQAAFISYLVSLNASVGDDKYDEMNQVAWNPGLRQLATYVQQARPTLIPEDLADLFDDVAVEYLARKNLGGAKHVHEERKDVPPQSALHHFLALKVWEGDLEEPKWIRLEGEASWITKPTRLGKKATDMLNSLPEGTCALRALLLSGVSYKAFLNEDLNSWKGATIQRMVTVLTSIDHPFQFYDSVGRLILKKDRKDCHGRSQLPVHKFMVGGGHVYPFQSRSTVSPLKLVGPKADPSYEIINILMKTYDLRGANGIDVELFYRNCGIRPPSYYRAMGIGSDLRLDCNKAYYSILSSDANVFPVPTGMETVKEYEEKEVGRAYIDRVGFYLVSAMPWLTCCPARHEEVAILFGGQRSAWVYGDVLLQAYDSPTFRVMGEYLPQGARVGTPPSALCDKWTEISQLVVRMLELEEVEVTQQSVHKRFHAEFVKFTGVLEKQDFTCVLGGAPKSCRPEGTEGEWLYHKTKSAEAMDQTVYDYGDNYEFTRCGYLRRTGCLAKLAVYQYMSLSLLGLWREVGGAAQSLTQLKTDSMSMTMSHARIPRMLDHLEKKGWLGPNPGQYKVERNAAVLGEEEAAGRRLPPQTPRVGPLYLGCPDTPMITREEVVAQAKSGRVSGVAIFGPGGAGKTHLIVNEVIPALQSHGHQVVVLTPTLDNLSRLQKSLGASAHCTTLQKFLSPLCDKVQLEKKLRGDIEGPPVTIILDEVGLATPADLNALRRLTTRGGLIVTGDQCQLSNGGDLIHAVTRLGLEVCALEVHEKSRHSGCPRLRIILQILRDAIEQQRREGMHQQEAIGLFPPELQKRLEAEGLPMVDTPSGRGTLLGWRRRHSTDLGGYTVHSSQGATIDGPITITDYMCDPRLLYTALSRVRTIGDVEVCRKPPTEIRFHGLEQTSQ